MRFKDYLKENKKDQLLEQLAELEHKQWMEWAKSIMKKETLSKERVERWKELFIPYDDLTEESKEQDRVYARKILKLLKDKE